MIRKRNGKRLYESIMKDVSKVIKHKLNETTSYDDDRVLDDLVKHFNILLNDAVEYDSIDEFIFNFLDKISDFGRDDVIIENIKAWLNQI